jgi:hypothetical protein
MDYTSFDEFEKILYKLADSDKYPTKSEAPLISPATYMPDTTRANDNVVAWGGFGIVDVDDYIGDIKKIESIYAKYKYICYSTASSKVEHPKFRLVFPLTRWIDKVEIKHFWFALNKEIGDIADAQTKDLSRMYYIPNQYKNSFNFIFTHDGDIMDPSALMEKHKYVEKATGIFSNFPPAIKEAIIKDRKNRLTNTNFTWTGYADCPFVNQKKVEEYKRTTSGGWYYGMYQIMVSIAGNATTKGYPISAKEIEFIVRDLDSETGNWYLKRPIEKEAERAIDFVFSNNG